MTFIASVVAKNGVAIIADSLVTSTLPIMHLNQFIDHLRAQEKNKDGEISLNPENIYDLFNYEPIYTKDYEEKLFKLNDFTAITTTGIASFNDKKIIDLVTEFISITKDIEDLSIEIEDKVKQFISFLEVNVKEHIHKYGQIGRCVFVVTFYDKYKHVTHIYKITIVDSERDSLDDPEYKFVYYLREQDWVRVVCEGQNKLSDNILYGFGKAFYDRFPEIVKKIIFKLPQEGLKIPEGFVKDLMEGDTFTDIFFNDVELLNLTDLSLQQAVDLASLLMRVEVDFQKYTRNVPTVGGVIKLAVIGEEGFKPISGYKIEPPNHIIK